MSQRFGLGRFADPKIINFLSAGVLNTGFGYSVYAVLLFIKTPYLLALFVATVVGIIFNYFSFGQLVFHGHVGWFFWKIYYCLRANLWRQCCFAKSFYDRFSSEPLSRTGYMYSDKRFAELVVNELLGLQK